MSEDGTRAEINFHERICLKRHRRIALGVVAFCALEIALVARSLFTTTLRYPVIEVFPTFSRSLYAVSAIFSIYILCCLYRGSRCASERGITGVVIIGMAGSLLRIWPLVHLPPEMVHAFGLVKLALYTAALLLAASDLRAACSDG